jgi:hypothetical protein
MDIYIIISISHRVLCEDEYPSVASCSVQEIEIFHSSIKLHLQKSCLFLGTWDSFIFAPALRNCYHFVLELENEKHERVPSRVTQLEFTKTGTGQTHSRGI